MRYRFNEFEFDSESLLLTNKGEVTAIRHTEAKVLSLLLEKTDTVLNKDDILSHVWQDKIVSEQVVFQNISHLRNMFGNEAIKTFPKRGYQWQLCIDLIQNKTKYTPDNKNPQYVLDSSQRLSHSKPVKKRIFRQLATLIFILFITISTIYSQYGLMQENKQTVVKLAYIPFTQLDDKTNTEHESIMLEDLILEDSNHFDFTELTYLDTAAFEHSVEIEYPKLSKLHSFVLTGNIRIHQQKTYLDFRVNGPDSHWQGHLSGSSEKDVIKQLLLHLKQPVIYDLISFPQPAEINKAKLTIAHLASPDDITILRKLSISYLKTGELEKAMVMADKLITMAQARKDSQHMGKALLYQSNLLSKMKLYELSALKLKLAIEQFEKINDLKHQSHAWYIQSWLNHQQKSYLAVKMSLLKSAQFAYAADDKLDEIEALTSLSLMAHNYQKENDKYFYLREVESKIMAYQLPIYHFSEIPFHHAIFAKTLLEKEPHLKDVLKFTVLTPESSVAQSSRRQLVKHYIIQNRLAEARILVESVTADNYNNSYLKTLMAQAEKQTHIMISHAQRTFEQAQLAGQNALSLDIALLLCNQQVNFDFYSQYISNNETLSWRSTNEIKLLTLNL
jgi:DNA-binding winged helix-turn-helix (wHTH) protein